MAAWRSNARNQQRSQMYISSSSSAAMAESMAKAPRYRAYRENNIISILSRCINGGHQENIAASYLGVAARWHRGILSKAPYQQKISRRHQRNISGIAKSTKTSWRRAGISSIGGARSTWRHQWHHQQCGIISSARRGRKRGMASASSKRRTHRK